LHALGEQPESELKKLLIPNFSVVEETQQWDKSVDALTRVKLVTKTNKILTLSKSLRNVSVIDNAVFAQGFVRGLVEVNLETIRKGEDPDDLFKAILWLSTLPAGYMFTRDLDQPWARLKAFGLGGLIANEEQMNIFRRWTRGLGLSREFKDGESIDFSELVNGIIKSSVVNGPLEAFIQHLEVAYSFLMVLVLLSNLFSICQMVIHHLLLSLRVMEVVLALEDSTSCIIYTKSTFLTDEFCLDV
jgi:hypothetical protein